MAQKSRSAQLTATAWEYCRVLVDAGEYCSIDDAVSDLIMQARRSTTHPPTPKVIQPASTQPIPISTPPVLASTEQKPENPIQALAELSFD
ncbi:hypothetical protein H6F95_02155 [Cyanobacteria bacterium FACHB-471]|nr:hypothetical protein [Cyanobacteria bacterium FACHB-471]